MNPGLLELVYLAHWCTAVRCVCVRVCGLRAALGSRDGDARGVRGLHRVSDAGGGAMAAASASACSSDST
jgi:hypothetical protein